MSIEHIKTDKVDMSVCYSDTVYIKDDRSTYYVVVGVIFEIGQEAGAKKLAINVETFTKEFFDLDSDISKEIAERFADFNTHVVIYGDYSKYTSKPLHNFTISRSAHQTKFYFVPTREEAIELLSSESGDIQNDSIQTL